MVSPLQQLLLYALLTLTLAGNLYAAPLITLSADELEYGKAFWLDLRMPRKTTDNIDLTPLQQDFFIDSVDEENNSDTYRHLRIRLYPYKTGTLSIPSLTLANSHSQPLNLRVKEAIDPNTNTPITVSRSTSSTTPWVRQQVHIQYEITTQFSHAQLSTNSTTQNNWIRYDSPLQYEMRANNHQYSLSTVLKPLKSGETTLALAPLLLTRDGVVTHKFYFSPLQFNVRALPVYMPANMPVGKVTLQWQSGFSSMVRQNVLSHLQFTLRTRAVTTTNSENIAAQLNGNSAIRFYPQQIQAQQIYTNTGMDTLIDYDIPFKPLSQGLLTLPAIRLDYFDPDSGTIITRSYQLPRLVSLNGWVQLLLALLSLFFIFRILLWLVRRTWQHKQKLQAYYRAVHMLRQPDATKRIVAALSTIACADGRPANMTVNQLCEHINGPSVVCLHWQTTINVMLYAGSPVIDKNICQQIINVIRHRHWLLRLTIRETFADADI